MSYKEWNKINVGVLVIWILTLIILIIVASLNPNMSSIGIAIPIIFFVGIILMVAIKIWKGYWFYDEILTNEEAKQQDNITKQQQESKRLNKLSERQAIQSSIQRIGY